jgi:hypothetical protein
MRQIRTSGSMSGEWRRGKVGYSGTGRRKGRPHARHHLNYRATPRLYPIGRPLARPASDAYFSLLDFFQLHAPMPRHELQDGLVRGIVAAGHDADDDADVVAILDLQRARLALRRF